MKPLNDLMRDLNAQRIKSRELIEQSIAAIDDRDGEGVRAILTVYEDEAIKLAEFYDEARARGHRVPMFAGIPITIKDLFDIAGEVTRAGSNATQNDPLAKSDAPAIARLKAAGFIVVGKANMTEFAYSGLGINLHFDTPRNPYERDIGRIPGGSTSGGAISVSDNMAPATIGTDTGGSCRIPAALCGITGFKPTATRVPTTGAFPLSHSLDSVGPLAHTVSCCAILDGIMSASEGTEPQSLPLTGLRLGVPQAYVLEEMDETVGEVFEYTLGRLADAGAVISEIPLKMLNELPRITRKGGLVGAEAYAIHRERLKSSKVEYDPWIVARIEGGQAIDAADYLAILAERANMIKKIYADWSVLDGLIMPTVPIIAPTFEDMRDETRARGANRLLLRNPALVNFIDGCALSLPCHREGGAPVGLMLAGRNGEDRKILSIGKAIETALSV